MLKRILYHIFPKTVVAFIYLSFFLVQFNIHLTGTPNNVSYFSCDYCSINNTQYSPGRHLIHSDSRHSHFKLNKRFHPKNLFTVPAQVDLLVEINYREQTLLVHADDPLTNYSFNSPSLRGPPTVV